MTTDKEIKDLSTLPLLITAGNALLTFLSIATGMHYTFHISEVKFDTETRYMVYYNNKSIGYLRDMQFHYTPSRIPLASEQDAFGWIWKNVLNVKTLTKHLTVYHNGRCAKCGRKLTVPASIESGVGPECSKLIFKS